MKLLKPLSLASLSLAGALCIPASLSAQGETNPPANPQTNPPANQAYAVARPGTMARTAPRQYQRQRELGDVTRLLNLTPSQQARARRAFDAAWDQGHQIMAQIQQNREQMKSLFQSSTSSANFNAQISRLAAQQGQLYAQMIEIRTRAMRDFYSSLTPEQKMRADALHDLMTSPLAAQMSQMRGHRQMEGGPTE